ncbi:DUF3046 domain-containing protein [Actinomyces vulturis]|uniref:DUF3046 domain-containing protein n=1 Tax=Actinomyces vulturis TaxID=1857645 RepID=UPI000832C63A|nr:DUF3046 domain-containing protein [Actinomyces vulturis]
MKHSEFWNALDEVFGSAYGRSLAQDLVLSALGTTASEALDKGQSPRDVWHALADDMELSDAQRWVFREDRKERRSV